MVDDDCLDTQSRTSLNAENTPLAHDLTRVGPLTANDRLMIHAPYPVSEIDLPEQEPDPTREQTEVPADEITATEPLPQTQSSISMEGIHLQVHVSWTPERPSTQLSLERWDVVQLQPGIQVESQWWPATNTRTLQSGLIPSASHLRFLITKPSSDAKVGAPFLLCFVCVRAFYEGTTHASLLYLHSLCRISQLLHLGRFIPS